MRPVPDSRSARSWGFPHDISAAGNRWVPLYEAKMIHHYDHRWASYDEGKVVEDDARRPSASEKGNSDFLVSPRYWVAVADVTARLAIKGWGREWLMGWRDITNATNERTVVASAIPRSAVGHTIRLMSVRTSSELAAAFWPELQRSRSISSPDKR